MFKNQAGQVIYFSAILKASGDDAGDISGTVSVELSLDAAGFQAGQGTLKYLSGSIEYSATQAETNANHVAFRIKEATIITQLLNIYPIDPALYKANVSAVATQAELDKVIKSGEVSTWASSLGTKNDVTVTRN